MAITTVLDLEASSSQYAAAGDSASLDVTGSLTLEAWVKLESSPGAGNSYTVIGKWNQDGGDRAYTLDVENAGAGNNVKLTISRDGGAANIMYKRGTTGLSTGTWYHIAGVYNAGTPSITIFVNGVDDGSADAAGSETSIKNSGDSCIIGARNIGAPVNYFDGTIAMARVWATTRTAANLSDNWCSPLGATTNLQAEWPLNGVYTDNSGNGNTLTSSGSPVFATDGPASCPLLFIPRVTFIM